jgi:hypothetical protein
MTEKYKDLLRNQYIEDSVKNLSNHMKSLVPRLERGFDGL